MSNSAVTFYLCYRNPSAAADWLCDAFGFRLGDVVRDADGRIVYISLHAQDSRILVGPASGTRFEGLVDDPEQAGGRATHVCYQAVENVDGHRRAAEAAGAHIELGPVRNGDGQVYYLCRDIEGHLWSFGAQSFGESSSHISETAIAISNQSTNHDRRSVGSAIKSRALTLTVIAGLLASGVWLASSNSHIVAAEKRKENSSGANLLAKPVPGTDAPARAQSNGGNDLKPTQGPTLVRRQVRTAASHSQLEKDLLRTKAELRDAKEHRQTAKTLLFEEREKFKVEIGKQQDKVAKLRISLQQAARRSEHTLEQLTDAKKEIVALKRGRLAEGRKVAVAAKELQEAGQRYDALASELESSKKELSQSRRAEAQVLAALTAWRKAADGTDQRNAAIETRQLALSRAVEALAQKLQEEHGRERDARRILATISRRVDDVRDQAAHLNGTLSDVSKAVRESTAKVEKHVVSLQTFRASTTRNVHVRDPADGAGKVGGNSPAQTGLAKSERSSSNKPTPDKGRLARYSASKMVAGLSTPISSEFDGAVQVDKHSVKPQSRSAKARKEAKKAKKKKRTRHARLSLKSRCARNAWSRLYKRRRRSLSDIQQTIKRLCAGAQGSVEPVRCMRQILAGRVDWGGGKRWPAHHALRLCAGTQKASARIGCFRKKIKSNQGWRSAISQCSES